jgi:hypothetical protein
MSITSAPEYKHKFVITNPERVVIPKEISPEKKRECYRRRTVEDHQEARRMEKELAEVWQ